MEEMQLSQQTTTDEEDHSSSSSNSEDFYEKIEAPKFVDFTLPDRERYRPDDRYWFCLRVGCDQKHEEELDPEEINKNFILRVMAARSPNIRLRKNLSRKCPGAKLEYPQSAPAKSSKPRISRLAVISSISHKVGVVREKVKPPIPKPVSTPKWLANKQSVISKTLTTPRNNNSVRNPKSSQSVQIPVATSASMPKVRMVAKTLIFNSPKNVTKTKYPSEIDTPLRKICEGMTKLEIKTHRKRMLGYSIKSPNAFRREIRKAFPVDTSSKQSSTRKLKTGPANLAHAEKRGDKEEKLEKCSDIAQREMIQKDYSEMDIDGKSRKNSLEMQSLSGILKSIGENAHKEILVIEQTSSHLKAKDAKHSEKILSEEKSTRDINGNSDANGELLGENASAKQNQKVELSYLTSQEVAEDNDDKENTSVHSNNRELSNSNLTRAKLLGNDLTSENNTQKNTRTPNKTSEKSTQSTAKDVQGILKYKKPKPTNPKPFRLRTDERGILKEANMDKKLHLLNENDATQRNKNGQMKSGNDTNEGSETQIKKRTQNKGQMKSGNDTNEASETQIKKITKKKQQEVGGAHTLSSRKEVEIKMPHLNVKRQATPMTNQKPHVVSFLTEDLNRKKKAYATPTPEGAVKSTRKMKFSVRKVDEHGTSSKLLVAKQKVLFRSSSRTTRPAVIAKDPYFHTGFHA